MVPPPLCFRGPAARRRAASLLPLAGLVALLLMVAAAGRAEVYHSRAEALDLAFGACDSVRQREIFLDQSQTARAEELAGSKLPGRLFTVYEGYEGGKVSRRAFFETHRVRTLPETLLVVVDPAGTVEAVHLLAFHEPPEYAPPEGWLELFAGRELGPGLSLRGGIAAIAGSTFTSQALTAAVRRVLAVHQVALGHGKD